MNNVYWIKDFRDQITLKTIMMYQPKCEEDEIPDIHEIDKKAMQWSWKDFLVDKFSNFHKCPHTVLVDSHVALQSMSINSNIAVASVDWFKIQTYLVDPLFLEQKRSHLMPLGELYTPLEKMILPFDETTWICFIFTMSFGVTLITILRFAGGSTRVLPGRNFARFILMLFILFCLIMRTAYQSMMLIFGILENFRFSQSSRA